MRAKSLLGAALALALLLTPAPRVGAIEPTQVSVEGRAELREGAEGAARDLAFQAALVEATLEVARAFLPAAQMLMAEEELRKAFHSRASSFVLTYRVDGPLRRRTSPENPEVDEVLLRLSATVDAAAVREELRRMGLLTDRAGLPSVVVKVRPSERSPQRELAPLSAFENALVRRLEAAGLVVVEPALRPAGLPERMTGVALARELGADLGIDVTVSWRESGISSRIVGGVVEVVVRAVRVIDAFELALARFEAPAYHEDAEEAYIRALEAVQAQVADNLLLQLERNWEALAQDDRSIRLRITNVTSLLQVNSVRNTLQDVLGAERADIVLLSAHTAELLVIAPLSPGALQDRLVAAVLDGFQLEPVEVAESRVELRVEPVLTP